MNKSVISITKNILTSSKLFGTQPGLNPACVCFSFYNRFTCSVLSRISQGIPVSISDSPSHLQSGRFLVNAPTPFHSPFHPLLRNCRFGWEATLPWSVPLSSIQKPSMLKGSDSSSQSPGSRGWR